MYKKFLVMNFKATLNYSELLFKSIIYNHLNHEERKLL
jgi:hypothetical protein